MSYLRRKTYISGVTTGARILKILALEGEYAQYDLPKRDDIDVKYRQVLRCLNDLQDKELIYLKRKEQSERGGKEKNIWGITFYGLMEVLKYLENKDIDKVAHIHSDKWLIFAEWPFLSARKPLLYTAVKDASCRFNELMVEQVPPFAESKFKPKGYTSKEWQNIRDENVLEDIKQECNNWILGLADLVDRSIFKLILGTPQLKLREKWLRMRSMVLASYAENPRIREYINKQFEREEAEYQLIESLRNRWKETLESERKA